jgi:hypothetical protein
VSQKVYEAVLNSGIGDLCAEVFTLLQIAITTPMTTAELERRFSTLKRVKTFFKEHSVTRPSFSFGHVKRGKVVIENLINF